MENAFKQPLFVVGLSLFTAGLATSIPAMWIPGIVFMVIAWSKKSKD
ncbi:hypothetical protein [Pseudomonas bubulae]|nr:hypothetical protein [Pseudomonas bubulae]MCF3193412.1 hypothetical protein [Pseudomonas bubulae]